MVKTENGTLSLNSCVMFCTKGGLKKKKTCSLEKLVQNALNFSKDLPRQDVGWSGVLGTRNEHKAATAEFR